MGGAGDEGQDGDGFDAIAAGIVNKLGVDAISEPTEIYREVEKTARAPEAWMAPKLVQLPRASGGFRTVGLLHMLYCLYSRAGRPALR